MDDAFLNWSLLIGGLAPFAISIIKSPSWPDGVKRWLAVGFAAAAGFIQVAVDQGWSNLDPSMILSAAGVILVTSQGIYTGLLEGTKPETLLARTGRWAEPTEPVE